MRGLLLAVAVAALLSACSNDETHGPPPPGCDRIAATGTCYSDPAATSATCAADGGTWLAGGCPGLGLSGTCYGTIGRTTNYYYAVSSYSYTTYEASLACDAVSGLFVPAGARVTASCDVRTSYSACIDLAGTESDMGASYSEVVCAMIGGTWSTSAACTTYGRTGTCSYVDMGIETDERYYGIANAADAGCVDPGETWTPG